jgi:hypothetical protein
MMGMTLSVSKMLDQPVPITEVGDGLTITPVIPYGS